MEICKNKKTGQTFIYLYEKDAQRALMITPDGSVKALDIDLFTEPFEAEQVDALVGNGKISRPQLHIYDQYRE
jgi:hypothetical protein